MIRQRLIRGDSVPPGCYRFTVPETGYRIANEHTITGLYLRIQQHYKDNNIPLPEDWKERVEDQMCKQLPEGWCTYVDGQPSNPENLITAENIVKGITSLYNMAIETLKGEDVFVSQEEADQRAAICARCYQNKPSNFCMGCGAMRKVTELVAKVKGSRKTNIDNRLQNCGICGCRNEAIVHVKRNILLSGEKSATTESRPNWCWLKNPDLNTAQSELHI